MHYDHINVPEDGEAITVNQDHTINVPDLPIIRISRATASVPTLRP